MCCSLEQKRRIDFFSKQDISYKLAPAGAFAVVERQGECGSKTAGMHVSQPMNIACVMG